MTLKESYKKRLHEKDLNELHESIIKNDFIQLNQILNDGRNKRLFSRVDKRGFSALHLCVARGNEKMLHMLLSSKKFNINQKSGCEHKNDSSDGLEPIHLAASYGYFGVVQMLINFGSSVNSFDRSDRTPLFLAASHSHQHVVNLLIKSGADVNLREIHGYSPLNEAVNQGNEHIVKDLLLAGAKVHYIDINKSISMKRYQMTLNLLDAHDINLEDIKCESRDYSSLAHQSTNILLDPMVYLCIQVVPAELKLNIMNKMIERGFETKHLNAFSLFHDLMYSNSMHKSVANEMCFDFLLSLKHVLCLIDRHTDHLPSPLVTAFSLKEYVFAEKLLRAGSKVDYLQNRTLELNQSGLRAFKMLYFSGFAQKNAFPQFVADQNNTQSCNHLCDDFRKWLQHQESSVPSLQALCRVLIRKLLGRQLMLVLPTLSLPLTIRDFLLFDDIDDNLVII